MSVTIRFNKIPGIMRALGTTYQEMVQQAARACETYAKDVVPVDTGMLKNSILAEPETEGVWIVAPHTEYDRYVEFGTSKMAAQPYMTPAAERTRRDFPGMAISMVTKAVDQA